jgi:hypothetical protein
MGDFLWAAGLGSLCARERAAGSGILAHTGILSGSLLAGS